MICKFMNGFVIYGFLNIFHIKFIESIESKIKKWKIGKNKKVENDMV